MIFLEFLKAQYFSFKKITINDFGKIHRAIVRVRRDSKRVRVLKAINVVAHVTMACWKQGYGFKGPKRISVPSHSRVVPE